MIGPLIFQVLSDDLKKNLTVKESIQLYYSFLDNSEYYIFSDVLRCSIIDSDYSSVVVEVSVEADGIHRI